MGEYNRAIPKATGKRREKFPMKTGTMETKFGVEL